MRSQHLHLWPRGGHGAPIGKRKGAARVVGVESRGSEGVTEMGEDESGEFTFSIGMECGGGITDSQTIRSLLEKTLVALP